MRLCENCGAETDIEGRGRALCAECKRMRRQKICVECGRQFEGKIFTCSSCKSRRYYRLVGRTCSDCGVPISSRATRCRPCQCRRMAKPGPEHRLWKGGKSRSKRGYVSVRRTDGTQRQVGEHRVVMESMLGRPLLRSESVHHKNGRRDDNRPENLELWVSTQPAGQRVEQLLAWAKEIVAMYG